MLPSIESVHVEHFYTFRQFNDNNIDIGNVLKRGSSTVRHLSFGRIWNDSVNHVINLALGSRQLETLIIEAEDLMLEILAPIALYHGHFLERVIFTHGYGNSRWLVRPSITDVLNSLIRVEVLTLILFDIIYAWAPEWICCSYDRWRQPTTDTNKASVRVVEGLVNSLPRTIHTLVFPYCSNSLIFNAGLDIIDDAFCYILVNRLCPLLKKIYFDSSILRPSLARSFALALRMEIEVHELRVLTDSQQYHASVIDEFFEVHSHPQHRHN